MPEGSIRKVVYDGFSDGRVYNDDRKRHDLNYYEYGEIWYDGRTVNSGVRDMQVVISKNDEEAKKKNLRKKTILKDRK